MKSCNPCSKRIVLIIKSIQLTFRGLVAKAYGSLRLNIIYTLSIISAGLLTSLVGYFLPTLPAALQGAPVAVGASGGIFGLFGALVSYGQRMQKLQVGQQSLIYATVLFSMGFASGNTDNWGHLGGFLGGYLCTQLPWLDAGRPQKTLDGVVAIACLGLTALSLLASIIHKSSCEITEIIAEAFDVYSFQAIRLNIA